MAERKFRVCYVGTTDRGQPFWQWECTLCDPPSKGGRFGHDAWDKIIRVTLRDHMQRRASHHRHVTGKN